MFSISWLIDLEPKGDALGASNEWRRTLVFIVTASLLMACAAPKVSTIVSMQDVSCQSCGAEAVEALRVTPGVYEAIFDPGNVEVKVDYNPNKIAPDNLTATIKALGYKACLGSGKGTYSKPKADFNGRDMKIISEKGEDVVLAENLVAGKVTVFDFFATWCGPCKTVDEVMTTVLATAPDVAYRKLNIVNWDSPLAKKHLGADVPEIPYIVVYGKSGEELDAISGLDLVRLKAAIEKGRAQ